MQAKALRILLVLPFLGFLSALFVAQGADGQDGVAVFRPSTSTWYFDYDRDGSTDAQVRPWAHEGDLPVAGDFDGDGVDDVAVFRPSNRMWYFDYGHNGTTDLRIGPWAVEGDLPVAGDFDGDGIDDIAVFRPSNRTWYFDYGHNGTTDDSVKASVSPDMPVAGDLPVAGDFDGDGIADVAIFRSHTGVWYFDYGCDGTTNATSGPWAHEGDLPIAGDFDGDGIDDVAVFRPSNRIWYYDYGHNGTTDATSGPWGVEGDLPLAGNFSAEAAASSTEDAITAIRISQISDHEIDVFVDYTYTGSHGFPVYIGALPTQGGTRAAYFEYTRAGITAAGSGTVAVRVTYTAASCIATDGLEVFMFTPFGMPGEPFLSRQFSQLLTWGCGSSGPLPPPPTGLPTITLNVDRSCGANYNPGDALTINISVSEAAAVTLLDFETNGRIKQIVLGTLAPEMTRTITGTVTGPAGVETLVAVARTASGVYVSTGCSFGIGGVSPSLVSLRLDRGCGGLYHYGETATITMQSSVAGIATLFNVTRTGQVVQLIAGQGITPGAPLQLTAPIGATTGRSTLVLRVTSASGQILTTSCSMNVLP